jgi:hypothetical protein
VGIRPLQGLDRINGMNRIGGGKLRRNGVGKPLEL